MLAKRPYLVLLALCTISISVLSFNLSRFRIWPFPDPGRLERIRDDEKTMKRFQKRLQVMKDHCPGWRNSTYKTEWVPRELFLINQQRHILACGVRKAGSSTWHHMIWAMRRKQAGLDPNQTFYTYADSLYNYGIAKKLTVAEGEELITYHEGDDDLTRNPSTAKTHRLILTRHPFARLISAWNQKFRRQDPTWQLLKKDEELLSYIKEMDPEHKMSWKDFARYVASHENTMSQMNDHFHTAEMLCKPCDYAYTYVWKTETSDEDEDWLFRRLNITDVKLKRYGVGPGEDGLDSDPKEKIKKYMAELDEDVTRTLCRVYKRDFEVFGYTFDLETLEAGGFE